MNISSSILATVAYSDIFDYPLTAHEVWKYLLRVRVRVRERERERVREELHKLVEKKILEKKEDYFFLNGREKIVELRNNGEGWSKEKWKIAQNTAQKLKVIPFIKMIGVTGALAMNNCKENDDIDLIIISAANSLWLTRFLMILFCPILGIKRRKRKEIAVKDKICFNLFLEEKHLKIEPENLFLAHEIAQVKPIFDRDNIYERFLWENRWVSNILPNAQNSSKFKVQSSKLERKHSISQYLNILISFFNQLAYKLQYSYMKPKMTVEKVSLHQAFFHPKDLSGKIQEEFERRVKNFEEN